MTKQKDKNIDPNTDQETKRQKTSGESNTPTPSPAQAITSSINNDTSEDNDEFIADLLCNINKDRNPSPLDKKQQQKLNQQLITAIKDEDLSSVQKRVHQGADVNTRDSSKNHKGWTPLHQAAYSCQLEIAQFLIDQGGDVNAKVTSARNKGLTPLHNATTGENIKLIELLIKNGADVNAVNNGISNQRGWTPLHYGCSHGCANEIHYLLANGANIDIVDAVGRTPIKLLLSSSMLEPINFYQQELSERLSEFTHQQKFQTYRILNHIENELIHDKSGNYTGRINLEQIRAFQEKIGRDCYKVLLEQQIKTLESITTKITPTAYSKLIVEKARELIKQLNIYYKQITSEGFINDKTELIGLQEYLKQSIDNSPIIKELNNKKNYAESNVFKLMKLCNTINNDSILSILPNELLLKIYDYLPIIKEAKNNIAQGIYRGEGYIALEEKDNFLQSLSKELPINDKLAGTYISPEDPL